jgi:hypothetical protein
MENRGKLVFSQKQQTKLQEEYNGYCFYHFK